MMRKTLAVVLLAATTLTAVSPAMAWGEREQGIVTGVVGTIIAQQIFRPPVVVAQGYPQAQGYVQGYGPQPGYGPPPVVYAPAPPVYGPPMVPYYPGTVYPDFIQRPMYKPVDVFIPECNCYRTMNIRIN